jgi:arabinofuranosyltransferase
VKQPAVVQAGSVGVDGYLAPTDVYVIDTLGLADPLASRLRIDIRGRPGHEKLLPQAWMIARFADPNVKITAIGDAGELLVEHARRAQCGELKRLIEATSGPLGFTEIFRDMMWAPRVTSLRFSPDPALAEKQLCANQP